MSCNIGKEATIIFNLYKNREEFLLFYAVAEVLLVTAQVLEHSNKSLSEHESCQTDQDAGRFFPEKIVLLFCDIFLDHGIYRGQTNVA